jgi:hypothetical protein
MLLPRSEWLAHQHRDTLSSIVGHPTLTSFLAVADGESIGRVRFEMTEVRESESEVDRMILTSGTENAAAVWAASSKRR